MRGSEDKFLTHLPLVLSRTGKPGRVYVVDVDAIIADVVALCVEVRILEVDGVWFEQPLLIVYMFPPTLLPLPLQPFGWPLVVLCHNLLNLAYRHSTILLPLASLTLFMKVW